MKKFGWFKCLTILFLSLALIVSGFMLNSYENTVESVDTAKILQIVVYVLLGIGAALLVFDIIVILIKASRLKVTEFALHFMRFVVIILSVSISAFIILENDYGLQSENAHKNELAQLTIAASVGITDVVGAETSSDEDYVVSVSDAVMSLVSPEQIEEGRSAALYLYIDLSDIYAQSTGDFGTDLSVGLPVFACGNPPTNEESINRAVYTIDNEIRQLTYFDYEGSEYMISTVPVYTTTGKCVGALELSENLNAKSALDLVNFPLIMTIGGAVILLIILYFALAHLLEVILRPRIGDNEKGLGGNPAFRLGNESARSISLLMSMCCTVPLCPIFFDFSESSSAFFASHADFIPELLRPYMPLLIYMATCIIGNRLGGIMKNSLNTYTVALGSVLAVAGAVMMLGKLPLIGVALWGLGYGIAARMVDKYRVYARYSDHNDPTVIYSPYLGLAAGILLGSFMYVRGGSRFLLICSAVIVAAVALLVCLLFRNTSCAHISRDGDEDFLNEVYTRNTVFGRFGILAVIFSVILSFGWFGLSVYLYSHGVTATAITIGFACVILGGGVVGNLYRKAETPMLRIMFGLSGFFLAASIVPFAVSPSTTTATLCYFLLVIAEILGHGTINAYLTQDDRTAGDDGVFGTADDEMSFNTKDRIGYWGQGNLLLEITSLLSVVGGVYLFSLDNMMLPLILAAAIAAIVAVLNLVLILTSKPSTALAVPFSPEPVKEKPKKEEKKEDDDFFPVPVPVAVPDRKKEKAERKEKKKEEKKESENKEKPRKEPGKKFRRKDKDESEEKTEDKPEEKPAKEEKEKSEDDFPVFDFGILLNDDSSESSDDSDKKDESSAPDSSDNKEPAAEPDEDAVPIFIPDYEGDDKPEDKPAAEAPADVRSQYGNGDFDDTPYPPLIGDDLKTDDVIAL